jgi:hypothetical protein
MGDSEAVAVETCQEIVNNYLPKSGCPNWRLLSPLLRGVLDQDQNAVTTCQQIFNEYLTRNGRPITGMFGDQVQSPKSSAALTDLGEVYSHVSDTRTVHDIWQEYTHGLRNRYMRKREAEQSGAKTQLIPRRESVDLN